MAVENLPSDNLQLLASVCSSQLMQYNLAQLQKCTKKPRQLVTTARRSPQAVNGVPKKPVEPQNEQQVEVKILKILSSAKKQMENPANSFPAPRVAQKTPVRRIGTLKMLSKSPTQSMKSQRGVPVKVSPIMLPVTVSQSMPQMAPVPYQQPPMFSYQPTYFHPNFGFLPPQPPPTRIPVLPEEFAALGYGAPFSPEKKASIAQTDINKQPISAQQSKKTDPVLRGCPSAGKSAEFLSGEVLEKLKQFTGLPAEQISSWLDYHHQQNVKNKN